eukprot:CAMPEP_0180559094 /NCGR_PEP_ID=MMETSP1037_2-20121125/2106_1 /TAXON_ID=632150 /ORGANISM="Azadinium spinosum, Strain 3D9" /LENGTH=161 /DNA_ID=CAMNT_0022575529 /DNA_START=429 /DNA_END=916 /DNA_ORIENTATION=-
MGGKLFLMAQLGEPDDDVPCGLSSAALADVFPNSAREAFFCLRVAWPRLEQWSPRTSTETSPPPNSDVLAASSIDCQLKSETMQCLSLPQPCPRWHGRDGAALQDDQARCLQPCPHRSVQFLARQQGRHRPRSHHNPAVLQSSLGLPTKSAPAFLALPAGA